MVNPLRSAATTWIRAGLACVAMTCAAVGSGRAETVPSTTNASPAAPHDQSYEAILAAVKADPEHGDYAALRNAYAARPDYSPLLLNAGLSPEVGKAMKGGDRAKVAAAAEAVLSTNWTDVGDHMIASVYYGSMGNAAQAALHRQAAEGLLNAIRKTGDGHTPSTAFSVISVSEEYVLLGTMHLSHKAQALITVDGHQFDKLDVSDAQGHTGPIYFNVDRVMAGTMAQFRKPAPAAGK